MQDSISKIHEKYPFFILEREEANTNCGALTTQSSITVNGDLKLCNMDGGEYFNLKLGNTIQEPIKVLYDTHTDVFKALRMLKAPNYDSEGCRDCEERIFCSHCILRGLIGAKRLEEECHWYESINPILKEHFA